MHRIYHVFFAPWAAGEQIGTSLVYVWYMSGICLVCSFGMSRDVALQSHLGAFIWPFGHRIPMAAEMDTM
jgi:hypothetical protein